MELLRTLTLIYAAVLVLALAVSLTLIWIQLRRIGGALGEARQALTRVAELTAPLDDVLNPLAVHVAAVTHAVREADTGLARADARLIEIADRAGAAVAAGPSGAD